MGKFQSKLAPKRRQSPEGGSLASNVLNCQREMERQLTENLFVELRANKSDCNLKVVLPPKKTPDRATSIHLQLNKQAKKMDSRAGVSVMQGDSVTDEDTQQEWVFTLCNSDKVTKKDMNGLIHSVYEILEASVKPPYSGPTPLKIKLVVIPSADPDKMSQIMVEKEQSSSQEAGTPVRRLYCVDENIERRNHYLDLAGIENYTSKFDNTDSPSQEPSGDVYSAPTHHPVVIRENCISPDSPRGLSVPHSLKTKAVSVRKDRNGGEGKSCRFHGQQPSSWCHPSQFQSAAHIVLQRSHSKRLRSRLQDASYLRATPAAEREISSSLQPSCGALASPAQRHEHQHHHEHHHHHHHHHYHPS